jgi:hypothetical protein
MLTYQAHGNYAVGFEDTETHALVAVVDVTNPSLDMLHISLRWDSQADEFEAYFRNQMEKTYGERLIEVGNAQEQREQYGDYTFDNHETEIPRISAKWQDVVGLLRAIFTDNDRLTFMLGEDHAFVQSGTGESILAWLRDAPWVGKRQQHDVEQETHVTSKRMLEIVTESSEHKGSYQRLLEIVLYRLGENQTRLIIRSYSEVAQVLKLHERMVSEIRNTWLGVTNEAQLSASKAITDEPRPREQRGMNANTEAKVREAHRLLKAGTSWTVVKKTCAYETYIRWCETVTGEEPVTKDYGRRKQEGPSDILLLSDILRATIFYAI